VAPAVTSQPSSLASGQGSTGRKDSTLVADPGARFWIQAVRRPTATARINREEGDVLLAMKSIVHVTCCLMGFHDAPNLSEERTAGSLSRAVTTYNTRAGDPRGGAFHPASWNQGSETCVSLPYARRR